MSDTRTTGVSRKELEALISHAQRAKVARLKWRDVEVEFQATDTPRVEKSSGPDDILFSDH